MPCLVYIFWPGKCLALFINLIFLKISVLAVNPKALAYFPVPVHSVKCNDLEQRFAAEKCPSQPPPKINDSIRGLQEESVNISPDLNSYPSSGL